MRDGRISGSAFCTAETSRDAVVNQMIGMTAVHGGTAAREAVTGEVALAACDLCVFHPDGREVVSHLDIEVRHGEVLGLFGLLGSGVIETTMALFGAWRGKVSGEVLLDRSTGIARLTLRCGAAGHGSHRTGPARRFVGRTLDLRQCDPANLAELSRLGFIDTAAARRKVTNLFDRLRIKASNIDVLVGTLSGGNQQKVQVARRPAAGARTLLLVDPTRGVDVGARAEINRIWVKNSRSRLRDRAGLVGRGRNRAVLRSRGRAAQWPSCRGGRGQPARRSASPACRGRVIFI